MLNLLRKVIPKPVLSVYHWCLAKLAALYYGNPSKGLIVVGVTGTKGKSTTIYMIAKILEAAGHRVGYSSTIGFKVAEKEWLNDYKMTMLGRFKLQKLLRDMVRAGCEFAIIETSSEGIAQHRHVGVWYDAAVFTGLTPEHLESHGGFENYKKAKLKLFEHLAKLPKKELTPALSLQKRGGSSSFPKRRLGGVPKVIVANGDSEHAKDFLDFNVDKKLTYSLFQANDLKLQLPGRFNLSNALAALAVVEAYRIDHNTAITALQKIEVVPGRMEQIENSRGIKIVVDYAHEPESIKQVYDAITDWHHNRVIHILGPTGGGRDRWRRPVMGEMAAKNADIVIVTTDDPYDDDREKIIREMAAGALHAGKIEGQDLFSIIDRRQAIRKALSLAQTGDLVLLTGKGAEQVMAIEHGKQVKWDDREVVREELGKL